MPRGLTEGDAAGAVPVAGEDLPATPSRCGFEQLSALADAVLYEGYLLYPYRRSSAKNRVRWQFGVLFPRDWVEASGPVVPGVSGSADSWYQQTECLLRVRRPGAVVRVKVRYLQMQHKQVEEAAPDGGHRAVASLRTDSGAAYLTFDEAVPREAEVAVRLADLLQGEHTVPVGSEAGTDIEPLPERVGRVVRRREEVRAHTTLVVERLHDDVCRIRVRTANTGPAPDPRLPRDEALRGALIATHTLLDGDGVDFVSLIDPPAPLLEHARACRNAFTFPVLGGQAPAAGTDADGTGHLLLSAPIILPDHPQVAPESPGDLHDAAEIDEILTLRTMLLTDEEKREARATDPRAAAILDRVDTMPPEVFARLHGAVRSLKPAGPAADRPTWWQEGADSGLSPTTDTVLVDGVSVGAGSRVRLRPRGRGADAQDMFLVGRTAQVAAVLHDVDGSMHLAVTLDDDPAAELHTWYGRFHYFRPDELEPLTSADAAAPGAPRTDSPTPDSGGR
ncbi:hypothetical protein BN159_0907 [Streptomyces davaonensis JCM 4913]|uniref:Uncharacterized protein n=1 Tax=Streptomyces davaonensis (strain DSM 101723 / JCM 4913 / KCC S-0913 / 768) TaxID=1214101 RepID=K4QSV0_STRDJ|nr:hypothetical protein [Streptomyces davaonensis]CCK25286.1 hypothetical protein BN159_0907 [Streptomyces davaonensis JCM 4913]